LSPRLEATSVSGIKTGLFEEIELSKQQIERGLAGLGIDASEGQAEQLGEHLELVRKWNRAYNLISRGDLDHLVTRHLLDSLSIRPFVIPDRLLDVGSGAGFPGLPLAVLDPGLQVTLLDSAGKKARFLRHAVRTLGLGNVSVVQSRAERFSPGHEFSTITSRAFGTLAAFAGAVRHVAGTATRLLAMKGRHPGPELDSLPDWVHVEAVTRIDVPGLNAERHVVLMTLSA